MIHPKTELRFISKDVGYGVFATDLIPEGSITYIVDSMELVVSPADFQQHPTCMQDAIEKYSFIDEHGNRIVSWDFAKYTNHCCNCNSISTGYGFEIATRDIQAGEQITDEYGIFNLEYEMEVICGEQGCRKVIRPGDFDALYPIWDERIRRSMVHLFQVEQPLLPLLDSTTRKALEVLMERPETYKSVYALRHHKPLAGVVAEGFPAVSGNGLPA